MISNISIQQNKDENIIMLAAQRQLYTDAKTLTIWLFIVSIIFPFVIVSLKPFFANNLHVYYALSLVSAFMIIPAFVLKIIISNKKNIAAVIQNRFDYSLFEFKWDEFKLGDLSEIQEWTHRNYSKYLKKHTSTENLKDWYPIEYSFKRIEEGRIYCQKCNVYWDGDLKKQYRYIVTGISFIIALIALILTFLFSDSTVATFCMKVFIPLIPVIFYLYITNNDLSKDIARINQIKLLINTVMSMIDKNLCNDEIITEQSILIQGLIFEHRKSGVLVLDVIYDRLKEHQESVAKANALESLKKNRNN